MWSCYVPQRSQALFFLCHPFCMAFDLMVTRWLLHLQKFLLASRQPKEEGYSIWVHLSLSEKNIVAFTETLHFLKLLFRKSLDFHLHVPGQQCVTEPSLITRKPEKSSFCSLFVSQNILLFKTKSESS